jgi:hypothetical protein
MEKMLQPALAISSPDSSHAKMAQMTNAKRRNGANILRKGGR